MKKAPGLKVHLWDRWWPHYWPVPDKNVQSGLSIIIPAILKMMLNGVNTRKIILSLAEYKEKNPKISSNTPCCLMRTCLWGETSL